MKVLVCGGRDLRTGALLSRTWEKLERTKRRCSAISGSRCEGSTHGRRRVTPSRLRITRAKCSNTSSSAAGIFTDRCRRRCIGLESETEKGARESFADDGFRDCCTIGVP